jgi:hypothetical protein
MDVRTPEEKKRDRTRRKRKITPPGARPQITLDGVPVPQYRLIEQRDILRKKVGKIE